MKLKKTLVVSCLFVLMVGSQVMAQTPEDLIDFMDNEYARAVSDHDLDKLMSFYTDDVIVDMLIYGDPFGKDLWQWGWADRFTVPGWHTDHGIALAVDNLVVVDHNAVAPESPGVAEMISPHLDILEFEGWQIKKETVYGGEFSKAELPPAMPAEEVPDPEPTGLSPMEANQELVTRWNSHDATAVARMDRADVSIWAGLLNRYLTRSEMMAINQEYFVGIPDVTLEVTRTIDFGQGWILTELIWKGTHTESFMGVAPAGYPVALRGVWLIHYGSDGLITHMRIYYDGNGLLDQMTTAPYALDGVWVTAFPTPVGSHLFTTVYTAQDAAKTRYSGTFVEINTMPGLGQIIPNADNGTRWAGGHAVMVGRNQYDATYLGFILETVETDMGTVKNIVGLTVADAHFEVLGPDLIQGSGTVSYYMAIQDADHDGFPDEGETPIVCIPMEWTTKRLTLLP